MHFDVKQIKDRLYKGGGWAFTGKLVNATSGLFIGFFLARILSPEELGAYFLIISLVTTLAIFGLFGLQQTTTKMIAENVSTVRKFDTQSIVLISILIAVAFAFVLAALLYGGMFEIFEKKILGESVHEMIVYYLCAWLLFLIVQNLYVGIYRGFHNIKMASLLNGSFYNVSLIILIAIAVYFLPNIYLHQVIFLSMLSVFISVVLAIYFLRDVHKKTTIKLSSELRKVLVTTAWPIWVTSIVLFMLTQLDIWIIGVYLENDMVAIYGAVYRVVLLIAMPLIIANSVLPPIVAESYAGGNLFKLEKTIRIVSALASIPSIFVLIIIYAWGGDILILLFGEFYGDGYLPLVILGFGQCVNVVAGSCGVVLMMTGKERVMMSITILSGVIMFLLSITLVNLYGLAGAAFAVSFSIILQNIMMVLAVRKIHGIWTHANFSLLFKTLGNR